MVHRIGGAEGIRTPDPLVANEVRYQLRHSPGRWLRVPTTPLATERDDYPDWPDREVGLAVDGATRCDFLN